MLIATRKSYLDVLDSDEMRPTTPASDRSRKRQRISDSEAFQCQVCYRCYDRSDHLNRHLDSHRNERSFRCEECPAGFNRRDLLLRHQAAHTKNAAEGQVGPNRAAVRAVKACDACVLSKLRCDNTRPCQRCQKKSLSCSTKACNAPAISPVSLGGDPQSPAFPTPPERHSPDRILEPIPAPTQIPSLAQIGQEIGITSYSNATSDAQALLDLYNNNLNFNEGIPSFFEQIMIPDLDVIGSDSTQIPPTLTTWMPELEADWLSGVDLFGTEFTPAIDQTLESQQVIEDFFASTSMQDYTSAQPNKTPSTSTQDDSARKRHAIFQRSPWFWVPHRNQHAFSEHDGPLLDERNVDLATSPHEPCSSSIAIPDQLSFQSRDRVFQLVSKTTQSQVAIPSFPSAETLDKLIKVGIAKRTETDAWIHPFTFCSETARAEYLTALVAAGCVCFGISAVSKTGLVLQEIVRVALQRLNEVDNSTIRDLQYLQAFMIWLDIGAFCGFRRKMEIAESNLQPLVTALRRAGRLDHVGYKTITPTADDSEEETDKKWRQWVEEESYKRLVYHLYEHDISMTLVKHRNPLLYYSELTLTLPASRNLWLATSSGEWRSRWPAANNQDSQKSLRDLLRDEATLRCLSPAIDVQVARSAYLYGLAAQMWEHTQQSTVLQNGDPTSQLWLQLRQQKIDQSLQNTAFPLENSPAIYCVVHQFLLMNLHVNLDTITRFAGKCGEEEARSAYTRLQPWSQTKEARTAVWHAGQLLGAARGIPPFQIRGQDSFMVYHATMVLWAYSMMMKARARRTGTTTPTRTGVTEATRASSNKEPLFLDEPSFKTQSVVDAFIIMDAGRPCLHIMSHFQHRERGSADRIRQSNSATKGICDLRSPSQIMKVGVTLLEATHPDVERHNGPPLLRALCGLMEELGNLR